MKKLLALPAFIALVLPSFAEPTKEKSPWEISGAANFAFGSGNSDSLSHSLQFSAKYEKDKNEALFGAEWLYSESDGETSTDSFRLYGQYNRLVTERFFYSVHGSYSTDHEADLDYRGQIGTGLGYYFIKNDKTSLSLETGPGLAWEKQGGESRDITINRFVQRFEHRLSDQAKVWQNIVYTPKIDDFSDYNLIAEAGIDTAISTSWALRTSIRYQYDSSPAAGREPDDTTILMGLSYFHGGLNEEEISSIDTIDSAWVTTTSLGFALNSGNSDSSSLALALDSAYREEKKEVLITSKYQFAEDDNTTSTDSLRANAQYNHFVSKTNYFGAGLDYLRNQISDISYRITPSASFGRYLIRDKVMKLSVEAGPGYTFEKVGGEKDDYFSVSAAEKFTWTINERTKFKQSLSAIMDPSNTDNFSLAADAQLDLKISSNLSWNVALTWTYDNAPADDREEEDTTLSTGVTVKF